MLKATLSPGLWPQESPSTTATHLTRPGGLRASHCSVGSSLGPNAKLHKSGISFLRGPHTSSPTSG